MSALPVKRVKQVIACVDNEPARASLLFVDAKQ